MKMLDCTSNNSDLESVGSTTADKEGGHEKYQSNKRPSATNRKDYVQRPPKRRRTRIKCDFCNATFDTSKELQTHVCRNDIYFLGVAKRVNHGICVDLTEKDNQIAVSNMQPAPGNVNSQKRVVRDDVTQIGDAPTNVPCGVEIKSEWLKTSPGVGASDSGEDLHAHVAFPEALVRLAFYGVAQTG